MTPKYFHFLGVRAVLLTALLGTLWCQRILLHQGRADAATPPPGGALTANSDYHPSFSDLMTMAVQPRHIKLGIAGRAGNWVYAGYEASELRNAFARIARTIPRYNGADTQALFTAMIADSLASVTAAIKDRDAGEFRSAYARLTAACNACHVAQRHAFVVIKVPTSSPYTDQDLGAGAK